MTQSVQVWCGTYHLLFGLQEDRSSHWVATRTHNLKKAGSWCKAEKDGNMPMSFTVKFCHTHTHSCNFWLLNDTHISYISKTKPRFQDFKIQWTILTYNSCSITTHPKTKHNQLSTANTPIRKNPAVPSPFLPLYCLSLPVKLLLRQCAVVRWHVPTGPRSDVQRRTPWRSSVSGSRFRSQTKGVEVEDDLIPGLVFVGQNGREK